LPVETRRTVGEAYKANSRLWEIQPQNNDLHGWYGKCLKGTAAYADF